MYLIDGTFSQSTNYVNYGSDLLVVNSGVPTTFSRAGLPRFSPTRFDASYDLDSNAQVSIEAIGKKADGTEVRQLFRTDTLLGLETFLLNAQFTNLVYLTLDGTTWMRSTTSNSMFPKRSPRGDIMSLLGAGVIALSFSPRRFSSTR